MRVVTWNMAAASPAIANEKHEAAWDYLLGLEPDVALVQEAIVPDSVGASHWVVWKPAYGSLQWGTAIVSRYPILDEAALSSLEPGLEIQLDEMQDLALGARLDTGADQPLTCVSVHAPAARIENPIASSELSEAIHLEMTADIWYADVVFGAVRHLAAGSSPFLVGGDWNTSRLWDEVYGPEGAVEFFERMEANELIDCVDRVHGKEQRSWFREGNAPYQLDHLFCDRASIARLQRCDVVAEPAAELGLSDHAPIVAEWAGQGDETQSGAVQD